MRTKEDLQQQLQEIAGEMEKTHANIAELHNQLQAESRKIEQLRRQEETVHRQMEWLEQTVPSGDTEDDPALAQPVKVVFPAQFVRSPSVGSNGSRKASLPFVPGWHDLSPVSKPAPPPIPPPCPPPMPPPMPPPYPSSSFKTPPMSPLRRTSSAQLSPAAPPFIPSPRSSGQLPKLITPQADTEPPADTIITPQADTDTESHNSVQLAPSVPRSRESPAPECSQQLAASVVRSRESPAPACSEETADSVDVPHSPTLAGSSTSSSTCISAQTASVGEPADESQETNTIAETDETDETGKLLAHGTDTASVQHCSERSMENGSASAATAADAQVAADAESTAADSKIADCGQEKHTQNPANTGERVGKPADTANLSEPAANKGKSTVELTATAGLAAPPGAPNGPAKGPQGPPIGAWGRKTGPAGARAWGTHVRQNSIADSSRPSSRPSSRTASSVGTEDEVLFPALGVKPLLQSRTSSMASEPNTATTHSVGADLQERGPGALAGVPEKAPPAKGAWASEAASSMADRLRHLSEGAKPVAGPPKGPQGPPGPSLDTHIIPNWERDMGLRVAGDMQTDKERRAKMGLPERFESFELVNGRQVNVVEGLELHKNLLSPAEQDHLVNIIRVWAKRGEHGVLMGRTYTAPSRSMKGKGRRTVMFGCCYNYAVDKQGRPPGILPEETVEAMPNLLKALTERLVRWKMLPANLEPDSAIINLYSPDDCIPPHIDHHDFLRPFCTISLVSQQRILFAKRIVPDGPGVFVPSKDFGIPLPPGSCLVLKGNGADVAMHCVPPVNAERISITLRCMKPEFAKKVQQHTKGSLSALDAN